MTSIRRRCHRRRHVRNIELRDIELREKEMPKGGAGLSLTEPRHWRDTWPYNYTGHPALTLPCAKSEGLPVGLQLVGRKFGEETMLRVAYAFQHSVNWQRLIAVDAI